MLIFLHCQVFSLGTNPQTGGTSSFILSTFTYSTYLQPPVICVWAVHLLPRTCLTVVTMTHLTWIVEVRTEFFMCDCGRVCHSMAFYGLET